MIVSMKSVIEEIYNCERVFCDEGFNTDEYKAAKEEFMAAYENLLSKLPANLKGELDEVFFLYTGVAGAAFAKKFKDGFELGLRLAVETLLNKN